jgi:hypothetical protein
MHGVSELVHVSHVLTEMELQRRFQRSPNGACNAAFSPPAGLGHLPVQHLLHDLHPVVLHVSLGEPHGRRSGLSKNWGEGEAAG